MNALQTIKMLKDLPNDQSIMLTAKHGVGKSSVVKQVADELGIGFYDVRLSQCEVGDIKGLPYLNVKEKITEFLKAKWWPRDQESKGILFFDELNRATKDVLQAIFEICLDRRLDGEKLPDGWRVVAAINGLKNGDYDVIDMDPALLDRWFHIDFDPSAKEWMSWASKSKIHPSIIEFINQNTELLDPQKQAEPGQKNTSRRSWVRLNQALTALNLWENPDEGVLTMVVKGWVGTTASQMFPRFLLHEYSRLKAEDVIDSFEKVRLKVEQSCSDIESAAALANSVIAELGRRSVITKENGENVKQFFMVIPKDIAANFWVALLKTPLMKDIVQPWAEDDVFTDYLHSIYVNE